LTIQIAANDRLALSLVQFHRITRTCRHVFYKPDVESAKIESRQGDDFLVFMRIAKAKFMLSDVLNTEQTIQSIGLDPPKAYSRAAARALTRSRRRGARTSMSCPSARIAVFFGPSNGYWYYEERGGGVYITCESITLTRDIPFGLGRS